MELSGRHFVIRVDERYLKSTTPFRTVATVEAALLFNDIEVARSIRRSLVEHTAMKLEIWMIQCQIVDGWSRRR